jgi:hypothetical protein
MINHPSMTSRGRRIAGVIAVAIVGLLPKHVECGYPGADCRRTGALHTVCRSWELEPLVFYGIELVAKRDVGFAYSSGEDCR